jgi:hypothetical protein
MELRWFTKRRIFWATVPTHPGRYGSPTHTVRQVSETTVLQYRDHNSMPALWRDVPTVVEETDETVGTTRPSSLIPEGAAAVAEAVHALKEKLDAKPETVPPGTTSILNLFDPLPKAGGCPICGKDSCRCHLGSEHSPIPE